MARNSGKPTRNRIVIETPPGRHSRSARPVGRQSSGTREGLVAVSLIAAAALATFVALFLTSRPYDPMNSTVMPQQVVPQGPTVSPGAKPSATTSPSQPTKPEQSPTPAADSENTTVPDDATIQSQIDRLLASDPTLSKLDVSTLVEGGKVTIVGSVKSTDLKQRVEKAIRSIKGVGNVDNQLVVTEATP